MRYDDFAARVVAEYELLLMALEGRYQRIRAPGVEVTPRVINDLQRDAVGLFSTFLRTAIAEIDRYTAPMLSDGSDELRSSIIQRRTDLASYLNAFMVGNVLQVTKAARTGVLGVAALLKNATGAQGALVQARAGRIEWKATDTSGRTWQAITLMQTVMRDFAYQCYVDFELDAADAAGLDTVMTSKGPVSLADLEELRSRYFHPNAHTTFEEPHVQT
jgi:hypothetical protein